MTAVFVDTSAWYAAFNRDDRDHAHVREVLESFPGTLVTSNFVFDEIVTLVRARRNPPFAMEVGETLLDRREVRLETVLPQDERAAWRLFRERADKRYSYTDTTSFVMMRRLAIDSAVALDDNFAQEGFTVRP